MTRTIKLSEAPMLNPQTLPVVFADGDPAYLLSLEQRIRDLEARVAALVAPKAYKKQDAAKVMGIGTWTLWHLRSLGKLRQTSYGTIPASEIDRHLAEEMKGKRKRV